MLNVKDLTDAGLRDELKKVGSIAGPITSTTRGIYEKKLKELRLAKGFGVKKRTSNFSENGNHTTSKRQTKAAAQRKKFGFSSDESDDNNDSTKFTKVMTSRRLHHTSKGLSLRSRSVPEKVDSGISRRTRSNKATLSPLLVKNGYSDDSSDSEGSWIQVQLANTSTSPTLLRSDPFPSVTSRRSLSNQSSLHSSPVLQHDSTKRSSSQDLAYTQTDSHNNTPSQTENANLYKPQNSTHHKGKNGRDVFRRRALSGAMRQTVLENTSDVLESSNITRDALLGPSPLKPSFVSRLLSRFYRKETRVNPPVTDDASPRSWSLHCSVLLPICTVIFFITLGLLYVTMRADNVGSAIQQPMIESSPHQIQQQRNQTMEIVNGIYEILGTTAGDVICNVTNESDVLFVGQLRSRMQVDDHAFFKALALIREHPQWEIFLYKNSNGLELLKEDSVHLVRFMKAKRPILPTFCRFKRAVGKVLFRVGVVLTAGLLIWLVILYRQYRVRRKEDERRKMFIMVEQILDLLKKHHLNVSCDDKPEPFIPILHVRDMLISPQERKARAKEWDQAVKFISASESRIRVETQRIAGEDYRVWRWIQVTSPNKRQHPPGRVWQGEAFDTNRSVNAPNISPTPCLKIRNMFDPDVEKDSNWHLQVQDSILEKCSDNNEIVSVVVEQKSKEGVVYVKCASCSGAGKAFKSLHGSWFDGRLVTVKFIKLQRFHTRYPHTADQTTPLRPSSSTPVSTFLPPEDATSGFLTSTPLRSDA